MSPVVKAEGSGAAGFTGATISTCANEEGGLSDEESLPFLLFFLAETDFDQNASACA